MNTSKLFRVKNISSSNIARELSTIFSETGGTVSLPAAVSARFGSEEAIQKYLSSAHFSVPCVFSRQMNEPIDNALRFFDNCISAEACFGDFTCHFRYEANHAPLPAVLSQNSYYVGIRHLMDDENPIIKQQLQLMEDLVVKNQHLNLFRNESWGSKIKVWNTLSGLELTQARALFFHLADLLRCHKPESWIHFELPIGCYNDYLDCQVGSGCHPLNEKYSTLYFYPAEFNRDFAASPLKTCALSEAPMLIKQLVDSGASNVQLLAGFNQSVSDLDWKGARAYLFECEKNPYRLQFDIDLPDGSLGESIFKNLEDLSVLFQMERLTWQGSVRK